MRWVKYEEGFNAITANKMSNYNFKLQVPNDFREKGLENSTHCSYKMGEKEVYI